jgi:hypothetical protein
LDNGWPAMDHLTCDLCKRELRLDSPVRYEVHIEVKAAHDPLDLDRPVTPDYRAEMARLLRQLGPLSDEEIMDRVYRTFAFDLCSTCQRRYIDNPLGAAAE